MNVDYENLQADLESGAFRQQLEEELTFGFRQILATGERLPTASHYASQIAEIVQRGTETPIPYLYDEVLLAVENARNAVLGEEAKPS